MTTASSLGTVSGKPGEFAWIHALYEIGQAANNGATERDAHQVILEHFVSGFDAESGSIALLVDGTEDLLEIAAGTDLPPGVIGSRLPRQVGVFGHVLATGEPLLINGDVAETRLPLQMYQRKGRPTHSAMCWPLRIRERTIGAIAVNRAPHLSRYTVQDLDRGQALTALLALVIANHRMNVERENRILELSTLNATMQRMNAVLEETQAQLIQSEKLASIGQIAAGVAHEINNPIGFVQSNLGTLDSYLERIFALLESYTEAHGALDSSAAEHFARARALREAVDLDFLLGDIRALIAESQEGVVRVRNIVQDLKDFSRSSVDEPWQSVNLNEALDRVLNMVRNETKYKARIETQYGELPPVECLPSRINQVFLNLIVNAAQSIESTGTITISSGRGDGEAWVCVEDTGCGIRPEHLPKLFDPFFTTKPAGMGTGLGLSISHSIMLRHEGRIEVESTVGRGSRFTVALPLRQSPADDTRLPAPILANDPA